MTLDIMTGKKVCGPAHLLVHPGDVLLDVLAAAGDVAAVDLGHGGVVPPRPPRLLHQLPQHRRARQRAPPFPLQFLLLLARLQQFGKLLQILIK